MIFTVQAHLIHMLIKKLAAPLINEKILPQAEHCYIATAAISEQAFDFIRTRLPPKCKIEIVTGLDGITSPEVLRKIWRHYHDRITIRIYTKNLFHANVFIFDLPYRKAVAFTGSGDLTIGGIKDNEEIFNKITDPKEIESLKSWFTGYYEFSEILTEDIVREYELIYPSLRQREIFSREEKEQVIELTTRGFNWDAIKFRNQYFKKEDYFTFSSINASLTSEKTQQERAAVKNKLLHLHETIKDHLSGLGLFAAADHSVSSLDPEDYPDQKLRYLTISYQGSEGGLVHNLSHSRPEDFLCLQIVLRQRDAGIRLLVGVPGRDTKDRKSFRDQMEEEAYRNTFFTLLQGLGAGYWISINAERKDVEGFQNKDALWEFTRSDDWRYSTFLIGKRYLPGDPAISNELIAATFMKDADKLTPIYRHIKAKSPGG